MARMDPRMGPVTLVLLSACGSLNLAPTPDTLVPSAICLLEGTELHLSGENLAPVALETLSDEPTLAYPTLTWSPASGLTAEEPSRESRQVHQVATWSSEGSLVTTLGPNAGLEVGTWDLIVSAPGGETGTLQGALTVLGRPTLDAVAPAAICLGEDVDTARLQSTDLVVLEDAFPQILLDGLPADVITAEDCTPLAGLARGEVCETFVVSVDGASLALGWAELTASQPGHETCSSSVVLNLEILEDPEIREVTPESSCSSGGVLAIKGAGFREGLSIEVGGVALPDAEVIDASLVEVSFFEDDLPTGTHDLTLTLAEGCAYTLPEAVTIEPPPLVYAIEPPVLPQGTALEIVARLADVSDEPVDAWLIDPSGSRVDVPWHWSADTPTRVFLSLDGTETEGSWSVGLALPNDCEGDPGGSLDIVSEPSLTLTRVDPGYAWAWDRTDVSLVAPEPPPDGEVGFVDLPRAWLIGPDGAPSTAALQGLTWRSKGEVTAVVPASLEVGRYDLVVVNPTGEVGLLERAVSVTPDAPPQVDSVQPASLESTGTNEVIIRGRDFRDPEAALLCRENGDIVTEVLDVTQSSYGQIEANLTVSTVGAAVCVVEVTNSDGTSTRYSGVSVRNPAQNLFPWEPGPDLNLARRAPAAFAGRTSSVTRYVYAIGGDAGDATTAMDTLEVADVDLYGTPSSWTLVTGSMPGPLTLGAAIRIEDFVYVVGGDDGTGPTARVWRARVLDPLQAPVIDGVQVSTTSGGSLTTGTWLYRVSALFDASDPINPGGESLASDPFAITLPWDGVALTLTWEPVDGASGYRVFRTEAAGDPSGSEVWLADTVEASLEDLGAPSDPSLTPLIPGSMGAWAEQDDLESARSGLCLGVARGPEPDPELYYLYAAGGHDGSALLDSIEVLEVHVVDDDEQRVGTWRSLDVTLDPPREHCSVAVVDSTQHSVVDEETSWVYVLAGDDGDKAVGDVQVGRVEDGGDLSEWQDIKSLSPARAGSASASASDFLYMTGGQQGAPSEGGVSAELEPNQLPDVRNWNSLSTSLGEPRHLPGSAQESAVWFVIGGDTESGATSSTDLTHY